MKQKPIYEDIDVPNQFMDLATRRTEFLFHVMTHRDKPLRIVLASAYLQGSWDAAQAMEHKVEIVAKPMPMQILPWHC